jgi:ligand-binding sensor domain-containing protein
MSLIHKISFILLLYVLINANNTMAQTLMLEHLSTANGLPNNSIQDIYQDSKGCIWIGTNSGLCKYDGKNIRTFNSRDGLTSSRIWGITEDKRGLLWLATYDDGIVYFDGTKFTPLDISDTINKHFRVVNYSPKYDCLLFGADNGLFIKTADTSIYFSKQSVGLEYFQIIDIHAVGDEFYIYTFRKEPSYIFNPANNTLRKYGKYKSRGFANIASAIINNGDTIIGYMRNYTAILKKEKVIKFENTGQIFDICKGAGNSVWLAGWDITLNGGSGGLFQIKNDSIKDYTELYDIPTRAIWSLYYDSLQDVLFVGTNDKGLFIIKNKRFEYYKIAEYEIQIKSIMWVDDKLWIAEKENLISMDTLANISRYDKSVFRRIAYNNSDKKFKAFYNNPNSSLTVNYINIDSSGNMCFASNAGLYKRIGKDFRYVRNIRSPFYFTSDKLFAVGWSQYSEYDLKNNDILIHNFRKEHTPVDIHKIVKHKNTIWFLSWARGLFAKEEGKYYWFNANSKQTDSEIKDITFDNSDNIFIAQNNGELLIFNYYKDSLYPIKKLYCGKEITGNVMNWIIINKHNQLFIGTDKGLNYINLNMKDTNWTFRFFNEKEGYSSYNSTTAVLDKNDAIWLNTSYGVMKINPNDFDRKHNYPDIYISEIDILNNKTDSLLNIKKPILAYNQNYITFHFHRNNYINADKDIFYYRLAPHAEQWIKANDNKVDFYNLQAGKYTFELKCKNINSGEESNIIHYNFRIKKPWWNTMLFYSLSITLLFGFWWFFTKRKINRIKRQATEINRVEKRIAELEMKALQSQMNPHFVFNSLNAIQNFVLDGDIDQTLNYIAHFSTLLRNTLDYSTKKYISIHQEQEFLEHYIALEQMRFSNDGNAAFEYSFEVAADVDVSSEVIPPMLLQPIIENSIKHGEIHKIKGGKVHVKISKGKGLLLISITDNGIGREKSIVKKNKNHHSKAMSIIVDRIQLLNKKKGAKMVIFDLEQGTRIEISLITNINIIKGGTDHH